MKSWPELALSFGLQKNVDLVMIVRPETGITKHAIDQTAKNVFAGFSEDCNFFIRKNQLAVELKNQDS